MNTREIIFLSFAISIAAVLQYYDWLFISLFLMFMTAVGVLGIYLSVSWSLVRGKQYKPSSQPTEPVNIKELLEKMMEKKSETLEEQKKVVVSRNIDNAVREVMDFVIRDFVLSWYTELSIDQTTATNAIKNDMWIVLENLSSRLSKIDKVKVMTQDVMELMYQHFNKIRLCSASKGPDQRKFILHAWLANEDTELEFLRKLCDAFLIVLLPSHYRGCISLRHLLREILTGAVIKPAVDMLCDPDYINRKLISYIDYRQRLSEDTKKTYTYAATYEDFIKLIDKCNDIEHLKQIRYNILTEIIHATTIDNLKKEQGPISDRTSPTPGIGKGELLKARNLKRYTNQLSVAKTKSEKRLHYLGGPEYKAYDLQDDTMETSQKVLTFQEIMESANGREEFSRYLKKTDQDSLMGFWNSVEKLKNMDKKLQHHQASEIYQQFIASSNSIVKLDKTTIKGMEAFMLGNQGPDKFYEGQLTIEHILQTQHYPSFLVSDIYNRYIRSLEDGTLDVKSDSSKDYLLFEPKDHFVDPEDEDEEMFASQAYEAQARIQQLDEKIENKTQALHAMRATKTNAADDSKIEKVEKDIEKELENLEMEKRMREAHILRTRTWIENQGQWRVHVYGAELVEEQDKKILVYVLVVYTIGGDEGSQNLQNSSNGWTVSRNLAEFQTLNEQLCQIGPWLKKKDIPSAGRFTTIDDKFIEESKKTLSSYLEVILKDERMAHSEALYAFLSPSPEYFKQNKLEKSNFFLRTILKKFPSRQPDPHDSDDELLFCREEETKLDRNVDSIAEPFYKLVNEIFESRGMFKWLRKSFIMFVEVTFGRTINRQLCETVDWIFSESMIIYYIQQFTLSLWPDGKLAENESSRSDEEKLKTRMEAKEKFLQNMPDAIKTLLGEDNGRRGTIKIFEVLQDTRLNKQLFYIIKCKAAVMREHKKPLIIENIEVAPPKAGELRIKIMYSSICHSDENYLGGSRPWIVDSILGHEGAGIVESVGEGVTEFKAGDHVIPSFMGQCNQCRTCKSGKTNVCEVLKGEHYLKGGMLDGTVRFSCNGKPIYHYLNTSTFSQYTVASEWSCVKIDPAAPLDKACLLGCGIATGYGSAINTAKVEPGSVCAVWGLGTIGLAVVMGCRNAGASRIIGIDTNPAKFEIAKKFGMTEGVNPKDFKEPLQDVLLKMTNGGLDYAFECIGNVKTMKVAFDSVHRCWGKVLIIGVAPITDEFVTNPYAITMGKQVIGSLYGDYKVKTISNLVTEYMNKKLMVDEFVTHKMGLDKINEGFDLLRSGKSLRTVLDMWA